MSKNKNLQKPPASIWTDAKRENTSGSEGLLSHHSVVDGPEELALPDVSTLLGYNPPPPDYSDYAKWKGLENTGDNAQQTGELAAKDAPEPSEKTA